MLKRPDNRRIRDFLAQRRLPPELLRTAFAHYFLLERFWTKPREFDFAVLNDTAMFSAFHAFEVGSFVATIPWANLRILGDEVMVAWAKALGDDELFDAIWTDAGRAASTQAASPEQLVDWFIQAHDLDQLAKADDLLDASTRAVTHDPEVGDWTLVFTFEATSPLEARTIGRRAREAIALRPKREQQLVSARVALRQASVSE